MKHAAWSKDEIRSFLAFTTCCNAQSLASRLDRSKAAIEGMRRKLKRLRELGVRNRAELVRLLGVCDMFVQHHSLEQIRRRARTGIPGRLYAHKPNTGR